MPPAAAAGRRRGRGARARAARRGGRRRGRRRGRDGGRLSDAAADLAARVAAEVRALAAAPRPAGSAAEQALRDHAAARLREAGFATRTEPFAYSALPGRWGTPAAGAAAAAVLLGAAAIGASGGAAPALALLVGAALALGAAGRWAARRGVLALPWLRAQAMNLVAERGAADGEAPRVWLVAHTDSKSQPVPIGLRALGVTATAAAWCALAAVAAAALAGLDAAAWWWPVGITGAVAAVPVMLTTVGARSPGALDNASGVATVVAAALLLPRDAPAGVLLTSAEELGLAGARAWVRGRAPAIALNCDGVDDEGAIVAMHSGRAPTAIHAALRETAAARGPSVAVRRLVPGILTDGVALADAGWLVTTISRGTRRTLARIHTPRDDAAHLAFRGVAPTARLLADVAARLAHRDADTTRRP